MSILRRIRRIARRIYRFRQYGLPWTPRNEAGLADIEDRHSIAGVLKSIRVTGWKPGTVIDVGVGTGTAGLYGAFPDAKICLIDPVDENRPYMEQIRERYGDVVIMPVAASNVSEEREIAVTPHDGLSDARGGVARQGWVARRVRTMTIDDIVRECKLPAPYLLKVDTDFHEKEILEGARETLASTEVCILETNKFADYIEGKITPFQMFEVMHKAGLAFYDFAGRSYGLHPEMKALRIVDFVFARRRGAVFDATNRIGQFKGDKTDRRIEQRAAALQDNPDI